MSVIPDEFYRIQKLPPYVFAVINEMKAKARAAQLDVVDLGMGNPDGATPEPVVKKLIEAVKNPRNHRYSMSRGIPKLREEMVKRYQTQYGVELDPETEAASIPARLRCNQPRQLRRHLRIGRRRDSVETCPNDAAVWRASPPARFGSTGFDSRGPDS